MAFNDDWLIHPSRDPENTIQSLISTFSVFAAAEQAQSSVFVLNHLFPSWIPLSAVVPSLLTNSLRLLSEHRHTEEK